MYDLGTIENRLREIAQNLDSIGDSRGSLEVTHMDEIREELSTLNDTMKRVADALEVIASQV